MSIVIYFFNVGSENLKVHQDNTAKLELFYFLFIFFFHSRHCLLYKVSKEPRTLVHPRDFPKTQVGMGNLAA